MKLTTLFVATPLSFATVSGVTALDLPTTLALILTTKSLEVKDVKVSYLRPDIVTIIRNKPIDFDWGAPARSVTDAAFVDAYDEEFSVNDGELFSADDFSNDIGADDEN